MGGGSLRAEIAQGIDIECKTKNNKLLICKDYEGLKAYEKTVTCTLWLLLFYPLPSKARAYFISFQL